VRVSGKTSRKFQTGLWLFVIIPVLAVVFGEELKTRLIWRFRVVDFIDLVFLSPFISIMLIYFNQQVFFEQKERKLYLVALGLMVLTLYGQAMHLTANAINTYSTEINHYQDQIPVDTYQLIYFLDEDLGHWLFYIGLIGSFGIWMVADSQDTGNIQRRVWYGTLPGALLGMSYSVSIIESSQPWLGFTGAVWLLGCALWSSSKLNLTLKMRWLGSIWVRIGLTTALMLVIGELAYLIIMGSFVQPSQLGL
jgi:hypothetical protein